MRRIYCFAVGLIFATAGAVIAQEIHSKHWIFGLPTGTQATNDLIIRDSYALSNNATTKFADWVAYRLTPEEVWGELDLDRKWRADPWLDEGETLEPSGPDDYKDANDEPLKFERGHLAPLAAYKGSSAASEVNYLSNITPQASDLNGGPWKDLETAVRNFVKKGNTVWVMTGPLFETQMDPLPKADETHTVPSGFWKIIATCTKVRENCRGQTLTLAAFIMPQTAARNTDAEDFVVSVDEIEQRTGFDLMPVLQSTGVEATVTVDWLLDE